jgi:hypothetical protein
MYCLSWPASVRDKACPIVLMAFYTANNAGLLQSISVVGRVMNEFGGLSSSRNLSNIFPLLQIYLMCNSTIHTIISDWVLGHLKGFSLLKDQLIELLGVVTCLNVV